MSKEENSTVSNKKAPGTRACDRSMLFDNPVPLVMKSSYFYII